ncbi:alpha/beta hydrolase [Muricauda sp. SCSIO 64092]|uniref:alpha/beta hydrolase family protein n=1 Tax=Allomuricauda sp. SCSIO 64092 TaxID=2908842 RepID=UPI001FF1BC91|nr:alpha/beta hydrolase [Muricauda sp. SCSIO 64092]UOY05074.1 alpha/beta hydrolase [Muricauda sp. SCSIO 64092]
MGKLLCLGWLLSSFFVCAQSQNHLIDFEFEGVTLNGIMTSPKNATPKGLVLIVHGSGRTKAVAQDWYADVREAISKAGYATFMYDKQGCGQSGGTFDYNQPVQNSAQEVIAAIRALKAQQIPGSQTIGLWGISRAGWINPLVINQYPDIAFWISVSGVYARENFNYLLEQNLLLDGLSKDSVALLVHEWAEGNRIAHAGGSFEAARAATQNLRKNAFFNRFTNGNEITREEYETFQEGFMKEEFDEATGQQIHVPNFKDVLSNSNCPVLALFGEKDKNVDWQKTKALYKETMGKHHRLTIKTFPDANHNVFQCRTGGFFEFQDNDLPYIRPEGFLETLTDWLEALE